MCSSDLHILNAIKATPLSCSHEIEDSLQWAFSKNNFFSLKSTYLLARGLNPSNLDNVSVEWVWKVETYPKIQFFLWLCLHNSVPTGEVLGSRGLRLDTICNLCHQNMETIDHLLRGCGFALGSNHTIIVFSAFIVRFFLNFLLSLY